MAERQGQGLPRRGSRPRHRAPARSTPPEGVGAGRPDPALTRIARLARAGEPTLARIARLAKAGEPTLARIARLAKAGEPAPARLAKAGEPTLAKLIRNRRQVLIGLGAGAIATGTVGSAAAVLAGGGGLAAAVSDGATSTRSPRDAGAFADRDASYTQSLGDSINLGAAGLAETASAAAADALKDTPAFPNPLSRDPVLHLLRRATFGPNRTEADTIRKVGIDGWIEAQLDPGKLDDPVAVHALKIGIASCRESVCHNV